MTLTTASFRAARFSVLSLNPAFLAEATTFARASSLPVRESCSRSTHSVVVNVYRHLSPKTTRRVAAELDAIVNGYGVGKG